MGTWNGPKIPATAADWEEPEAAMRADVAGGQGEVKPLCCGALASVSAARSVAVGDAQELKIL